MKYLLYIILFFSFTANAQPWKRYAKDYRYYGYLWADTLKQTYNLAYNATTWNGNLGIPTMDAIRDKFESIGTGQNISNASLSANGSYTHDWNQQQLKVDTISFLHLTGTDVVSSRRQNIEIRQQANTFSLPFQAQAAVKTADGVTDSLINRFRIFGHLTELGAATSINDGAAAINATTNGEGSLPQAVLGASDGTFPSNRGSSVTASPTRLRLLGNDSITIKGVEAAASGDSILSVIRTTNNEFKLRRIPYTPGAGSSIYTGSGSIPSGTTTVTVAGNVLAFASTASASSAVNFTNTGNGNAISMSSSGSGASAVASNSGSGVGMQVTAVGGNGMNVTSDNATAVQFTTNPSTTSAVTRVANYRALTTGTAAANMGGSIGYQLEDNAGSSYGAVQLKWVQTDAAAATRTAGLIFSTTLNAVSNDRFSIAGSGQVRMYPYGVGAFTGTNVSYLAATSNGTVVEQAASTIPLISTGTAAPGTTPAKVGDMYVDTTNKKLYIATGTASSADWTITN